MVIARKQEWMLQVQVLEEAATEGTPRKEAAARVKGTGVGYPSGGLAGQRNVHTGQIEATGTATQGKAAPLPAGEVSVAPGVDGRIAGGEFGVQ